MKIRIRKEKFADIRCWMDIVEQMDGVDGLILSNARAREEY